MHALQEWRWCVRNAQAQLEHQANRLLNLEVAESKSPPVFLHYNKHLEAIDSTLTELIRVSREEQDRINLKRKSSQEHIVSELVRNKVQRQEALVKCWQIYRRCEES